ncbi:hypothetical protein [Burkholderia vietnamiensis]|uniref:hypothetical protein n=1 Tax=Burkholderia vietnamiensis TaxID=60552 RepID=UPI00075BA814|nr:hypothetical protein [Burkholderia vietnamiensis]KVR84107.1 hypothetical protein WK26_08420 [Burkholderia vietnamiensis]HDR9028627.1 hypothetical protein [Burkholderia vietnamiensis]
MGTPASTVRSRASRARRQATRHAVGTSIVRQVYADVKTLVPAHAAWVAQSAGLTGPEQATATARVNDHLGAALLAWLDLPDRERLALLKRYMRIARAPA